MAMTLTQKTDMYRFFAIAFDAAPGIVYMDQLDAAYAGGMTTQQIVNVFTTKPQFTATYPNFLDSAAFATKLVDNVVGASASDAAKLQAVADIVGAMDVMHMSRGDVIYTVFNNLAAKSFDDPTWGNTAKLLANQVEVAKYYTETLVGDSTDLTVLRSVIVNVSDTSDVTTPAAIEALIDSSGAQTLSLTSGATDHLIGGTAGDLFLAQTTDSVSPTAANTLHASDIIDGGQGVDTLRVTADGVNPLVGGFTMINVENLEVRSYATTGVTLGLVNVTDLEKVISTSSTGDITLNDVQSVVALDLTGNGSSPIDVTVNYATDKVTATDDAQAVTLDRFMGSVNVNGVETVNITAHGRASDLNLNGNDIVDVTVVGDQDLDIQVNGSEGAIRSLDANTFTGNLHADVALDAAADGGASLVGGSGDDSLHVWDVQGDGSVTVTTGEGTNDVIVTSAFSGGGDVDLVVNGGSGDDSVEVTLDSTGTTTVNAGAGNNVVDITEHGSVSSIEVNAGAGDDEVYINSLEYAQTDVTVAVGNGDNTVEVGVSGWNGEANSVSVTTGTGYDDIRIGDVNDTVTVVAGDGGNFIEVGDVNNSVNITAGAGGNEIYVGTVADGSGGGDVTITTGDDADTVSLVYADTLNATLGGGDDSIYLANGLEDGSDGAMGYTIAGGEGSDTLVVDGFEYDVNADGAFANVTSVETLVSTGWNDVSGSFDGVTTGANDAGIVNYVFENAGYAIDDTLELNNVANNVTVTFVDGATSGEDFTLSVDEGYGTIGTEATINVQMYSGNSDNLAGDWYNYGLRVNNVETLNLNVTSIDEPTLAGNVYLEFGGLSATTLKTLNISGNADVYVDSGGTDMSDSDFYGISADHLSLIDASTLNGNINTMDLANVAETGVTVKGPAEGSADVYLYDDVALTFVGGAGDDYVYAYQGDAGANSINDSLSGGAGDDSLYSYAGDDTVLGGEGDDYLAAGSGLDSVDGGAGSDEIYFAAGELTASDTVIGGEGTDLVYVGGSLGAVNDAFFYKWDGVEQMELTDGGNVLSLGAIAHDAGLETIYLSYSGNDTLNLNEGFTTDLNVFLSAYGTDIINDNMNALTGGAVDVTVYGEDWTLNGDTLNATADGGAGVDTIVLQATNGYTNLQNVSGFDKLVVTTELTTFWNTSTYQGDDINIYAGSGNDLQASGDVFTVDASALVNYNADSSSDGSIDANSAGQLYFSGGDETGGTKFVITGGDSADSIYAGVNADTITGGLGNDLIYGNAGNDSISAGAGDDSVSGGDGNDNIQVADGNNWVDGGAGDDTITATAGNNNIAGGDGADSITTGAGNDTIVGGAGIDTIAAGTSYDTDLVTTGWQGTGNVITGGLGGDLLSGGAGVDTYLYTDTLDSYGVNATADTITGFAAGTAVGHDVINLSGLIGDAGLTAGVFLGIAANLGAANSALNATAADTILQVVYVTADNAIYGDTNDNGVVDAGDLVINLVGQSGTLNAVDFVLTAPV